MFNHGLDLEFRRRVREGNSGVERTKHLIEVSTFKLFGTEECSDMASLLVFLNTLKLEARILPLRTLRLPDILLTLKSIIQ